MRTYEATKRLVDLVGGALLLLLSSPVILLAAVLVRLTSRGSVFYVQERVGRGKRPFSMVKLRTMVRNAERSTGPVWAKQGDPRITFVGRFLRKWHIDELPQLVHVVTGQMTLVGPRPERSMLVRIFGDSIPGYDRRHEVKPGLTGLAQVRHKYDETIADVRRKLAYDLFYVRNRGWRLDLLILWRTIGRIARAEIR